MVLWLKRIGLALAFGLVLLIAVLLLNTLRYTPPDILAVELASVKTDIDQATQRLSQAVRFETDSTKPDSPDFDKFVEWLQTSYPAISATLQRELINQTPLYTWQGSDPSLKPVMLTAHYDVVPVLPASLPDWVHPPWSGTIADGYVWGRGTLDDKGAIIAMFEAVDSLIASGFKPRRTIYFSFGHDEEVSGSNGARKVTEHLKAKGVQLDWILDEGSFVLDGVVPGLSEPIASINLAEKGYVNISLIAKAAGGHSSLPPKETAVGILAKAIDQLQTHPVPGGLSGVSGAFFDGLGRHFGFGRRILFANTWLFGPLLETILSNANTTNAMLRTTTAPTMLSASDKINVLPVEAIARINFRLHPRDTPQSVADHVKNAINDDRVTVLLEDGGNNATPESDATAQGYLDIRNAINATFGPIASVPGLTIAATDARHYGTIADNAYRINPFRITSDDLTRFHGTNERLSVENLERGIVFYTVLMRGQ